MLKDLKKVQNKIAACRACPNMCGLPVHGPAIETQIMLVGQAPGEREESYGKPFAYTAGKTLFKWLDSIGVNEKTFRENVYIAAVARCFPGKSGKGDREPDKEEIERCREHLKEEVALIKPKLILAIGRLAMREVLGPQIFSSKTKLKDVVGLKFRVHFHGIDSDVICLPHPSGVSRWTHSAEGKAKLESSLKLLSTHSEWKKLYSQSLFDKEASYKEV